MVRKTKHNFKALTDGLSDAISQDDKWQTYKCHLVTPMYGGGVKTGEVDKEMPIRASSIRGQLRFWWRIACGPFNSAKEMFDKETDIWGGIGGAKAKSEQDDSSDEEKHGARKSKVQIKVKPLKQNNFSVKTINEFKRQSSMGIKYVLGSVNGPSAKLPSILSNEQNIQFDIDIYSSEEVKPDVETALRWWASFGGIGAKTRRGFGALKIEGIDSIPFEDFNSVQSNNGCEFAFINQQYGSAQEAWEAATEQLYKFRQGNIGRNQKTGGKAGRSFWPEADQLRHLTGKNDNGRHMPEFEKNLIFPRAAFGLPIQFQFPGENNDPDPMTLQPIGSERLASPLILRPYLDENKKWRAVALLLPHWEKALTQSLELEQSLNNRKVTHNVNHWPDENQQAERDRLTNDIKPMKGRPNDPLSAFLDYFKQGQ